MNESHPLWPTCFALAGLLFVPTVAAAQARAPEAAAEPRTVALVDATLVDGSGAAPRPGSVVVLRDDSIVAVADALPAEFADDAEIIDVGGRLVVPGLIEGHTHLATNPSRPGFLAGAEAQLRELLGAGITAMRDMAGDGRALAWLARQTRLGELPGPDLHYAALLAGPGFFADPRSLAASQGTEPGTAAWAHAVTPDTDVDALMQRVRGTGAAGVKIYADVPADLLVSITTAAHAADLRVWAHWLLHPRQADAFAVQDTGVDVVSHAHMPLLQTPPDRRGSVDDALAAIRVDELIEGLVASGALLDATLIAATGFPARDDWIRPADFAFELVRRAHAAGVPIVAGSDHPDEGGVPGAHLEYRLLEREIGMSFVEVVRAATSTNARALGIEARSGTIATGMEATLLVLDTVEPGTVEVLASPLLVVKRGRYYAGANLRDAATEVTELNTAAGLRGALVPAGR